MRLAGTIPIVLLLCGAFAAPVAGASVQDGVLAGRAHRISRIERERSAPPGEIIDPVRPAPDDEQSPLMEAMPKIPAPLEQLVAASENTSPRGALAASGPPTNELPTALWFSVPENNYEWFFSPMNLLLLAPLMGLIALRRTLFA